MSGILTDSKGNALISEEALPKPRPYTNKELTAFTSALARVMIAALGPEVAQLIAAYSAEVEEALDDAEVGE